MKVKLTMRPFSLDVEHESGRRRPEGMKPWSGRYWFGDSLYRAATRRVIGELLEENRRLRRRQQATLVTALARAFDAWLVRRFPPPPPPVHDD